MKLTNTVIHNTKPGQKTQRLFDGNGLYLEVSPSGGKWWRFKYRLHGKEKRLSLGTYPEVTLKEARNRRDEARKLLSNGVDPSAHRKATKAVSAQQAANSFEGIAREWFTQRKDSWVPAHASRNLRRLEKHVFPYFGSQPVPSINAPDLLQVIRRIEQRGTVETAHRVLSLCSQVLRYAVITGRAERDAASDLRGALQPVKAQHFAAVTEPQEVAEVLRAIDGYAGTPVVYCALHLAPLLFVRPGELRHMQWADIDWEAALWRFVASKTGQPHIVPLSRQAVEILRELHPLTGRGQYVFPSARNPKGDRPMSDNAVLAALRRMDIDKEKMSGHGWRAVARTLLDEVLGFRPDYIEHQLAHAVRDPLGRSYNRTTHLPERQAMMQIWADYLDDLRTGMPPAVAAQRARQSWVSWQASHNNPTVVSLHG